MIEKKPYVAINDFLNQGWVKFDCPNCHNKKSFAYYNKRIHCYWCGYITDFISLEEVNKLQKEYLEKARKGKE